ncbi:MAG: DUF4037 domain-containing protein [Clostridia bacterium]|nr:DUF4037 domain-containing protein [Clostridia bacterium]
MKGLELSHAYYLEYGKPMIERDFAEYAERIAVGLVGHGSECFGFDDEISADHDFDAGFCIWLTDDDEREFGFKLFRAYSKLPKEYKGYKIIQKSLFGSEHKGVHTISEFYRRYTGTIGAPQTAEQWLQIPDFYLAEATNGEVFCDPLGSFTAIRNQILNGMPQDVWFKKIAAKALTLAQTGQYNFNRCLSHGEAGAAALALSQFAQAAVETIFLLNRRYAPYYKWLFRAGRELPILGNRVEQIEKLITDSTLIQNQRLDIIEGVCADIIAELKLQGLTNIDSDYLEPHAYAVNDKIKDSSIRNLPL